MAIYTVRPDEAQELHVEALKAHYNEKAATKALLMAAADVPKLAQKIERLEAKLVRTNNILSNYQEAANNINRGLECFKIYNKALEGKTFTNHGQKEFDI